MDYPSSRSHRLAPSLLSSLFAILVLIPWGAWGRTQAGAPEVTIAREDPPAPAEFPKTPAGRVAAAWLAAFNSGDPAQLRAFDEAFPRSGPPVPMEQRLGLRKATGGCFEQSRSADGLPPGGLLRASHAGEALARRALG